jgi:hypothetical protein
MSIHVKTHADSLRTSPKDVLNALAPALDEGIVLGARGGSCHVRLDGGSDVEARLTTAAGHPETGARVVVVQAPRGPVVIATLARPNAPKLQIRQRDGACELSVPDGELHLRTSAGRVVLDSATDVDVRAGRDLRQGAARRATLRCEAGARAGLVELDPAGARVRGGTLDARGRSASLHTRDAHIVADAIETTARTLVDRIERYELVADRIVETARETVREVKERAELRAGSVKTRIREGWKVWARRTTIVSKEDTAIDGRRVLLG